MLQAVSIHRRLCPWSVSQSSCSCCRPSPSTGSSCEQELRERLARLEAENAELRRRQTQPPPPQPPPTTQCSGGEVRGWGRGGCGGDWSWSSDSQMVRRGERVVWCGTQWRSCYILTVNHYDDATLRLQSPGSAPVFLLHCFPFTAHHVMSTPNPRKPLPESLKPR